MATQTPPPVVLNAELSDKINGLIDTMNQQKNAICDAKCMRNKELQKLYNNYTSAKQNFRNGEKNIEDAEEKYYLADKGSFWYSNFKLKNAEKLAANDINKIENDFTTLKKNIQRNIDYYSSQLIYKSRMGQLLDNYDNKLKTTKTNVDKLDSSKNISKRLIRYYEKDLEIGKNAFYYVHLIYWTLVISIILYISWGVYKKKYLNKEIKSFSITIMCFLFIPLLLQSFYRWVL